MTDMDLLVDLHLAGARQGPGADEMTAQAIRLAGLSGREDLRVADIGCGTGASTLVLAKTLPATVMAVDLIPAFLSRLRERAKSAGLTTGVIPTAASMAALPFAESSLDVIWSEGAVYTIGFRNGVTAWRRHLKPGGVLAVTELSWFSATRPTEIEEYWTTEYPEVDTVSAKLAVLADVGLTPLGCFHLPEACWWETYYGPLRARFPAFLARHGHSPAAKAMVAAEEAEMALFARYAAYVGYAFYVARRPF